MLAVKELTFNIGNFSLKNINLNISKNEYFVLLGRSGSGKTTLIKCISGLHKVTKGKILLNEKDVTHTPSEYRNIGYLPQNFALFPHLNVQNNILFGLKTRKYDLLETTKRIDQISNLLSIKELLKRNVENLSGGEKQKVALARALIVYPDILLLDEPFSSIDHGLKVELWFEVKEILKKLNTTVIHITHNLDEAHAVADNIAVLINGKIEQSGSKEEIFLKPKTEQVALYQGIKNIYTGQVIAIDNDKIVISNGSFKITALKENNFKVGQKVKFCIRPQDIKIIKEDSAIRDELKDNLFEGEIISNIVYNEFCIIKLKSIVDFELRFPVYIYQRYHFHVGKKISIGIWQKGISIFEDEE
jgi:ABC-type Fe3+/spermidine/putrescine transport system ATPase subunit